MIMAISLMLSLIIALPVGLALTDQNSDYSQSDITLAGADDLIYNEIKTTTSGTTTVTAYSVSAANRAISGSVIIPDKHNDLPVTRIDTNGFYGCEGLTSVTIPSTITTIGNNAFKDCVNLSTVYFNATSIYTGSETYLAANSPWISTGSNAGGFTAILGNLMTAVPNFAFVNADHLKEVVFGPGVTQIGDYAFAKCPMLESISIPDKVTKIGAGAFSETSITELVLPSKLAYLGNNAFKDCVHLATVTYNSNVMTATTYTNLTSPWIGAGSETDGVTLILNDNMTAIVNYAFMYFEKLKTVVIPPALETFGDYAFQGCAKLQEVTIPSTVTSIGSNLFKDCSNLATVYYNAVAVTSKSYSSSSSPWLNTSSEVPEGATLLISKSVTNIPSYAFYYWYHLSTVYYNAIAATDTVISSNAYTPFASAGYSEYQDRPVKLIIGNDVTRIPAYTFQSFSYMTYLEIGESVQTIAEKAFQGCSYLNEVHYNCVLKTDQTYTHSGSSTITSTSPWYNTGSSAKEGVSLHIGENVETIPGYTFYYFNHVSNVVYEALNADEIIYTASNTPWFNVGVSETSTTLTVGDDVKSVPRYAFYAFANLDSAEIGAHTENVSAFAFGECSQLKTLSAAESTRLASTAVPDAVEISYLPVHIISFNTNGGSAIADKSIVEGRTVSVEDPIRDGYTFSGWYTDSGLKAAFDPATPVTSDLTLYAKWDVVQEEPVPGGDDDPKGDDTDSRDYTVSYVLIVIAIILLILGILYNPLWIVSAVFFILTIISAVLVYLEVL